jgi:hypothetical protein
MIQSLIYIECIADHANKCLFAKSQSKTQMGKKI